LLTADKRKMDADGKKAGTGSCNRAIHQPREQGNRGNHGGTEEQREETQSQFLTEEWGNPSSRCRFGSKLKGVMEIREVDIKVFQVTGALLQRIAPVFRTAGVGGNAGRIAQHGVKAAPDAAPDGA
jgi:hypothetical protein